MSRISSAPPYAGSALDPLVDPRAREEVKLARCAAAAGGRVLLAADIEGASLFLLAAGLLPSEFGVEAGRLRAAAESFVLRAVLWTQAKSSAEVGW